MRRVVTGAVERTRQAWHEVRADLPLPSAWRSRLEEHHRRVPLLGAG